MDKRYNLKMDEARDYGREPTRQVIDKVYSHVDHNSVIRLTVPGWGS